MLNWISIDTRRPDPDEDGRHILLTRQVKNVSGRIFRITESDTIFLDNDGLVRLGSGNHWRDVVAWMPFPNPFDGLRMEAERCSRG